MTPFQVISIVRPLSPPGDGERDEEGLEEEEDEDDCRAVAHLNDHFKDDARHFYF